MATQTEAILRNEQLVQLDQMGVRRFDINQMRQIAGGVRESITQRIFDGRSISTFLKASPENLTDLEGKETIVLEVGGTNMRFAHIKIVNGKPEIVGNEFGCGKLLDEKGDEKKKYGSAKEFFDRLFDELNAKGENPGLNEILRKNPNAALSIIFSFPGIPEETPGGSLDSFVPYFTKGFDIPELKRNNFMQVFNEYLKERKLGERQQVIFNDTPILISGDTNIGLVVGTGYNFAIKMRVGRLREIKKDQSFAPGWAANDEMLVNIEAGGMDDTANILYAEAVARGDRNSSILAMIDGVLSEDEWGKQLEEKLIAGQNKGLELQLVLLKLKKARLINSEIISASLEKDRWKAEDVSAILRNQWDDENVNVRIKTIDKVDRQQVKEICEIIRDQAAQIVACHLVGALDVLGEQEIKNITEGSFFWGTPQFKNIVQQYLCALGVNYAEFIKVGVDGDKMGSMKRAAVAGINYIETHAPQRESSSHQNTTSS